MFDVVSAKTGHHKVQYIAEILYLLLICSQSYIWPLGVAFDTFVYTRMLILLTILLIHHTYPTLVESRNFSFTSFGSASCDSGNNLICWGSVNAGNGTLNITPEESQENTTSVMGRVLYGYPVRVWPASFSTTFTIRILSNSSVSGDGMAFVIAQDNRPSPPQSYGSFIGVLDPSTEGGVIHQLAVVLDTYKNAREIDGNHIAIVTTSIEYPVAVRSLSDFGINLKSGRNITINIDYDGVRKMLNIFAAYAGEVLVNILSQKILMQDTVPRQAYVGFTGSIGHFPEVHQVLGWNFTLYDLPEGTLNLGVGENKTRKALEIAIPVMVFVGVGTVFCILARRRIEATTGKRDDIAMLTKDAVNAPKFYSYKELSKATGKFSKDLLLGSGGFGCVYKGVLSDQETNIAVKKIHATSNQGEREFLAEICTIGRLRHKNLLQLQGWCHYKQELLLVYDYMPNGSLDRYIGKKEILNWQTRHKILSGLASVLLYLHEECGNTVVHRDVKPNNVMLDSDYNAHLGDFGLARLLQNNAFVSTMVAGTLGYLAPEVSYTGRATPESDVYSFGMVILELVCGKRSKGVMDDSSLVDEVWSLHEKGSVLSCVDRKLGGEFDEEQAQRCLLVGLACSHPDPVYRPKMRKVVQLFLNPEEQLMKLPECRPTEICLSLPSNSPCTSRTDFGSDSPVEISIQYDQVASC